MQMKKLLNVGALAGLAMASIPGIAGAVDHFCPGSFTAKWGHKYTTPAPGPSPIENRTFSQNYTRPFVMSGFSNGRIQCTTDGQGDYTSNPWDPDQAPAVGNCVFNSFAIHSAPNGFVKDIDFTTHISTTTTGTGNNKRCTALVRAPNGLLSVKKTVATNCTLVGTLWTPGAFVRCP